MRVMLVTDAGPGTSIKYNQHKKTNQFISALLSKYTYGFLLIIKKWKINKLLMLTDLGLPKGILVEITGIWRAVSRRNRNLITD